MTMMLKAKRVIAILLITILTMMMSACATKTVNEAEKGEESRMVIVEETSAYCIVYDKYTRVMYEVSTGTYNYGNFTVLVDVNGDPLLYEN